MLSLWQLLVGGRREHTYTCTHNEKRQHLTHDVYKIYKFTSQSTISQIPNPQSCLN